MLIIIRRKWCLKCYNEFLHLMIMSINYVTILKMSRLLWRLHWSLVIKQCDTGRGVSHIVWRLNVYIYRLPLITLFIVISSIPNNHRRSSHRSRNLLPVREKESFPFPPIGDLEIILRPKYHEELESHDLFHLYQSKVISNNVSLKPWHSRTIR